MPETAIIEVAATGGGIARAIETPWTVMKNNVRRRVSRAGRSSTMKGIIKRN